jgi:hypothetical protein
MLFAESGGGTPSGAYVRYALRQMTSTNKLAFQNLMNSLDINSDKGANAPYGKAMFEAFKYYGGGTGSPTSSTQYGPIAFAGFGQDKRDYAGNALKNPHTALLAGNAFTSAISQSYVSPISDGCAKNYVIFISNGKADAPGGDGGNPNASTLLSNVGGNTTTIPLPNTGAQATLADEYARFLYNTDVSSLPGQQNIITYTVAVYEGKIDTQTQEQIDIMKSMANQGHGRYFAATDASALSLALQTIFNEIQAVNSVFASVTLPVSVNVRGTNLNQVYMGVFRPDADSLPRWPGNLKEYKLAVDPSTGALFLADRNGLRVENPSTGLVVDDAVSYWTSSSTFWSFQPSGNPPSAADSPDGALVEKGAVAQSLRTVYATLQTGRKIYTCVGCAAGTVLSSTAGASTSFDPANSLITAAALTPSGVTPPLTAAERTTLIDWVRGQDNATDENLNGNFTDARASIHGDVLHSRPVVINYNRVAGDNDVVIFYGANDGMFRAVKGGTGATDGYEKWAFVPSEFYSRFEAAARQLARDHRVEPEILFRGRLGLRLPPRRQRRREAGRGRRRQSPSLHQHAAGWRLPLCAGRERSGCAQGALEQEFREHGLWGARADLVRAQGCEGSRHRSQAGSRQRSQAGADLWRGLRRRGRGPGSHSERDVPNDGPRHTGRRCHERQRAVAGCTQPDRRHGQQDRAGDALQHPERRCRTRPERGRLRGPHLRGRYRRQYLAGGRRRRFTGQLDGEQARHRRIRCGQ